MKCAACPVTDGPCVGECPGKSAACAQAAAGDPDRLRAIVGRSRFPCPGAPAPAETPALAEHRRLRERALACPHRSDPVDCGCRAGEAVCLAGRSTWSDGKVTLSDCIACVRTSDPSTRGDDAEK
jgi:hypothetical protein